MANVSFWHHPIESTLYLWFMWGKQLVTWHPLPATLPFLCSFVLFCDHHKIMISFVFHSSCIAHCYLLGAIVWLYVPCFVLCMFLSCSVSLHLGCQHLWSSWNTSSSSVWFLSFQQAKDFHEDASIETREYIHFCVVGI